MLIDEAFIVFRAGHGGPGRVSFYPGEKAGPDGGNGGRGGDVYLQATSDLTALRPYTTKKVKAAGNGEMGGQFLKFGKDGADIVVNLPVGSVITDQDGNTTELTYPDQKILFCKGGLGGRGNAEFKSSRRTTPEFAQTGLPGVEKDCTVVLKLIADFGLIGFPNAGKSSLINELTKADVKVANYPFTTLEPNLGALHGGKIIADVPGLIEGAHAGKGLGIKFLKHIEKVGTLLHCLSAESDNLKRDYDTIRNELGSYNEELLHKPEMILLTKHDLLTEQELNQKLTEVRKLNPSVMVVSIHDYESIEALRKKLTAPIKRTTSVGAVVLNDKNQVALVCQYGETWSLPKGHTEENEDELETALREIYEETNIPQEELTYVKKLGSFERMSLGGKQFQMDSELKTFIIYLYKTNQENIKPNDTHITEAKWVDVDEVSSVLTSKVDGKFFESIKKDLYNE